MNPDFLPRGFGVPRVVRLRPGEGRFFESPLSWHLGEFLNSGGARKPLALVQRSKESSQGLDRLITERLTRSWKPENLGFRPPGDSDRKSGLENCQRWRRNLQNPGSFLANSGGAKSR